MSEWLAYIERQHAAPIALGLERVLDVKCALRIKQGAPVITVGGTNGKGSVCAMLERILLVAGYRVGLYSSPHLLSYNERVRIDGQPVSDDGLCAAFAEVEQARDATPLTFFEFGTLAAWQVFSRAEVDVVILEVGLGGRLDAVNAFDTDCAVITTVDLDHMDYLGDTREAIGFEKAGIFRKGRPAIVGDPQVPTSVLDQAARIGATVSLRDRDFGFGSGGGQWTYWDHRGRRGGLAYPALRGAVQLANASTAIAALEALAEHLPVSMQDIRRGLMEVELLARFQVLPGQPTVVLDVCHNPQAARILAANLDGMSVYQKTWGVFSMLADKDISGVVKCLEKRIDHWFISPLPGPRSIEIEAVSSLLRQHGVKNLTAFETPAQAFLGAKELAGENDRIVAFGSFLTVAGVMRTIDNERKRRTT